MAALDDSVARLRLAASVPAETPRSWVCECRHRVLDHALERDASAPGGVQRWMVCLVAGCPCKAVKNETGTINERND